MHCSLAQSLEVIGDWWTPLILRDLYLGLNRFDQFVGDLGISRNLLTDRLSTLIAGGLVRRSPYQENPVRYAYELTDAGQELVPILLALTAWGDRWATPPAGQPPRFTHAAFGKVTTATVCCSECGEALTSQDVTPSVGPGGERLPGRL
ncbi:winged helix-turn-helix transcriptional regulator [Kribbella sp. NPDC050241]|uniref:winged helix-turn-helix transcriptional regulator n=1 Tax=Kribbella sp. NPDC050241 TaxID=3364115 RepID=UPI00378F88C6